jgi:hypothetical protein
MHTQRQVDERINHANSLRIPAPTTVNLKKVNGILKVKLTTIVSKARTNDALQIKVLNRKSRITLDGGTDR